MSQPTDPPRLKQPTKIFFGSDYHYERLGNLYTKIVQRGDIPYDAPFDMMVIVGDLTHSAHVPGLLKALHEYTQVPIYFTPGNHEFWDGTKLRVNFEDQVNYMRDGINKVEGVTFLYNEGFDIPNTNSSLFMSPWFTNLSGYVEDLPQSYIQECIGDYYRTLVDGRALTAADHIKWNFEAVQALGTWLETDVLSKGRIPIIGTHFGPSRRSAHRNFPERDLVASYFNTDYLDTPSYIWPKGSTWIHGHTHQNLDYMIGDMRVVTNQFGYKGESETNDSYDFMKHIEVY